MVCVRLSCKLTCILRPNGDGMVVPGFHRTFLACVGATPEDHYKSSLKRQDYGVPEDESLTRLAAEGGIVSTAGKVGSVIVFDCNHMHGSNGNITPLPRSNAFIAFNAISNAEVAPFGGTRQSPDFTLERRTQ